MKNMKVKHVLMIAAVLLAMLAVPVSADETVVTYTPTERYNLVIPEGMTVGTAGDIGIEGLLQDYSQVTISVSSGNDWQLKLASGKGGLGYALTWTENNNQMSMDADGDLMTVKADEIAGTDNQKMVISATAALKEGVKAKYQGDHTDLLTFTTTEVVFTPVDSSEDLISAINEGKNIILTSDFAVTSDTTITVGSGKDITLDLNGHTLSSTSSGSSGNKELFLVKGTLTVQDGTITYKHTGDNMGWNAMSTIFDVTAGGVLNMNGVTAQNLGGTDMNFVVHLNNWGEVTLNADNCVFDAPYCGVRVFNSGYDMNNVKITNSKLTGKTRAFWVHNYIGDLNSAQHSDDAIKARLNIDIYNNNNEFSITGTAVSPIRYGFETTVYFDKESGYEVTP